MWLSHLKLEMSALHVFRIFFLLDGWIILRVIELMWTFLCKFIRVPRSQTLLPKYDVESDFFGFIKPFTPVSLHVVGAIQLHPDALFQMVLTPTRVPKG